MTGREDYYARQERRRERLEARVERLKAKAAIEFRKADLREEVSGIPFGQPILVGHHSEGRHRRAIDRATRALDRAIDLDKAAGRAASTAANIGSNGAISSDAPDAIELLREKLAKLEEEQARMTAANKLVRKKDRTGLVAMFSEKIADQLLTPDYCGRLGFPSYALTNNGANIRRVRDRIAAFERASTREHQEVLHNSGVRLVQNVEANRIQLVFPGKPAAEIRDRLKRAGFRWSPEEGAWQRLLNNGAIWAAKSFLETLTNDAREAVQS